MLNKKNKFSLIAGITGAVVGVGAAIAGAVALKNPKTRNKVKKIFNNVKNKAVGYVGKMQNEIKEEKQKIKKIIKKTKLR